MDIFNFSITLGLGETDVTIGDFAIAFDETRVSDFYTEGTGEGLAFQNLDGYAIALEENINSAIAISLSH